MSVIEALLSGMAANGLYGFGAETARAIVDHLNASEPGKIAQLEATAVSGDDQRLREEIGGALRMVRASGLAGIDDATIDAVRLATFDHAGGRILIEGVAIDAPTLRMDGKGGAHATTMVAGEDKFRSLESDIDMERGIGTKASGEMSNL